MALEAKMIPVEVMLTGIETFKNCYNENKNTITPTMFETAIHTLKMVEEFVRKCQAFDAVEVVRCKDCKHWQPIHEHIPHMECQIFCGAYEHGYPTNADDFCCYGERKDNGK